LVRKTHRRNEAREVIPAPRFLSLLKAINVSTHSRYFKLKTKKPQKKKHFLSPLPATFSRNTVLLFPCLHRIRTFFHPATDRANIIPNASNRSTAQNRHHHQAAQD